MAASDDFKEQLKAGNVVDALTLALSEAIELKITTWVSSDSEADANSQNSSQSQPLPGNRLRTRINIVDGEIDNEVGTQFIGYGPYSELRQFHMEQIQAGRQMLQQNMATLQQLFIVMTNTLSQMPPSALRRSDGNPALPPSNREDLS